eukprot:COSAG01_NODE_42147_length_443_cov_0.630814_1_plen_21_part_10
MAMSRTRDITALVADADTGVD